LTDKFEWQGQVGRSWAAEWRRTDRSFTGLTDVLLGRAAAYSFRRALDVGCGAGELSLALARGHAGAEVVGVDVSDDLIAIARSRSGYLGNVAFEHADAETWVRQGFAPDLVVSRHGVMFFDEPVGAFRHLAHLAQPSARLVFSCFRELSENPWADRILALLPGDAPPPPAPMVPGPFAFAYPWPVEAMLGEAGWVDVHFEPVDFAFVLGSGDDPVEDALAYLLVIGPAARAARMLADDERAAFIGRLRTMLASQVELGMVAMRAGAWIVSARRVG
jgi:SAM-dependent methyltransferase